MSHRQLKKKNSELPLVFYGGGLFPSASRSFSKVYSTVVFHQLDTNSKRHALAEMMRILQPGGGVIIADWGKPSSTIYRYLFYSVQLLDGFEMTSANVEGMLPDYIQSGGFGDVQDLGYINTIIGTFGYYSGTKLA